VYVRLAALIVLAATSACSAAPPGGAGTPLIERTRLFGNPSKVEARLSPDGRWLSWLAPRDGVLNIWVAPAGAPSQARPLTAEAGRPIQQYVWAPDSSMVLFINDAGGDENFLLYGVEVATGAQRTLTPFQKTRAQIVKISPLVQDRILVGLNDRDPRWHDVYSLDLRSGTLTPVLRNDGYAAFVADETLALRVAARARQDGGTDFHRVAGGKVAGEPFGSVGLDDSMTTRPLRFTADGRTLYWVDSRGRDTAALVAEEVATGRTTVVAQDARADVGNILVDPVLADPRTGVAQAYLVDHLRADWVALDPAIKADLDFLAGRLKGEVTVTSRTLADDAWTVEVDPVAAPPATYLYRRRDRTLDRLFVGRPELEGAPLVDMHPLELKARDGLTLVSYLSLPPGSDPDGDGRPEAPVPTVLLVHGGPWIRDHHGHDPYHQWLANRGYAVLSVNYRGSSGFGKGFLSAGDGQWAGRMHDDLLDAVAWAVASGVAAKDKVAIMGGSYGGYATLVGLAFTPDIFACGVDIVGPSNLTTLLETTPAYWESLKRQLYKRIGDPTTEEGRRLLRDRSPLFRAGDIRKPLLIAQGANDPRVKQAESDQIVQAAAARGVPVTYVLFPDEGHGFARPENNIAFAAVAENFLQQCLGGRAEPIGGALGASSARVPHGAAFVPGLAAALSGRENRPE